MTSYALTLRAQRSDDDRSRAATAARVEGLLSGKRQPSDSEIAGLAARDTIADAKDLLSGIIRSSLIASNTASTALVSLLMPWGSHQAELHAYLCGVRLGCFKAGGSGVVTEPLKKLRARKDSKAILARYLCKDLSSWSRADRAARAVMILRRLIEARHHD